MTGMCKWRGGKWITTSQELAQAFEKQVINAVERKLHVQRNGGNLMRRHMKSPYPPHKIAEKLVCHSTLKVVSFNITTAWRGRLELLLDQYSDADIICVRGTAIHKKWAPAQGRHRVDTDTPMRKEYLSACENFWVISWGWSSGELTNQSCGVLIAINVKTLPRDMIVQRYDQEHTTAGRYGAIRPRTGPDQFLAIVNIHAPQENTPTQKKDKIWEHIHTMIQKIPSRCCMITTGDFNGDVVAGEDQQLIGDLYHREPVSENGGYLTALAHASGLSVPHTWTTELRGTYDGWAGETFFGKGNTRIDHILTSEYALAKDEFVDVARGYFFITGGGTALNNHVPIGLTISYDTRMKYKPLPPPRPGGISPRCA